MKFPSFLEGISWHYRWRVAGTAAGIVYCVWAFIAGVLEDRFSMLMFSMVASLYFFTAGKSHSAVKAHQRKQRGR